MKTTRQISEQYLRLLNAGLGVEGPRGEFAYNAYLRYCRNICKYFGASPTHPVTKEQGEIPLPRSIYAAK